MSKAEDKKVGSANNKLAVKAEKTNKETASNEINNNVFKKPSEGGYKEKAAEIEENIMLKINANPAVAPNFRKLVSVNKLMETGAHIGLISKKWNPKMKPYVYTKKGLNYIIDLLQTVIALSNAYNFLVKMTKDGGTALIVGTRGKPIKSHIKEEARRSQSFYINERWLGGTLTNFRTISQSTKKFNNLLVIQKFGDEEKKNYTKKEQVLQRKEIEKMAKFFGGIRTMKNLPSVLILTDPENEKNALKEAKKLNIPVIAICNTNANPDGIDYVIPANNYSIKSVYLLVGILNDAIAEGKGLPKNFVGKKDEEILLPEIIKRKNDYSHNNRRIVFDRANNQTSSNNDSSSKK